MRLVLVLVSSLAFTGCAHSSFKQVTGTVKQNGLSKFADKDQGVVCYVYENGDAPSVSCLKTGE